MSTLKYFGAPAVSVAIIMNGNGEWSGRRGLPPTGSRAAGAAALRDAVTVAFDAGIRTLTLYTLCTPSSGRHSHETSADLAVLERGARMQLRLIVDYVAHDNRSAAEGIPRSASGATWDKALLDAWRSTHPQALEKFHEQGIRNVH